MSVVPRIETARLLLRAFRRSDFEGYAAHLADPVAQAHLQGVVDRRTAWRTFAAASGFWMLDGAGWWAVEWRDRGEVVGTVGAFFRETAPEALELGWSVYRPFWGQGFATEAARAALELALTAHARRRAIAHIDATNVASVRVAERLGMRYETDVELYGALCRRYAIERTPARE